MQDMQYQMVRDEDSVQLMVTKGRASSFGMPLAPMALEIMREKRSISESTWVFLSCDCIKCVISSVIAYLKESMGCQIAIGSLKVNAVPDLKKFRFFWFMKKQMNDAIPISTLLGKPRQQQSLRVSRQCWSRAGLDLGLGMLAAKGWLQSPCDESVTRVRATFPSPQFPKEILHWKCLLLLITLTELMKTLFWLLPLLNLLAPFLPPSLPLLLKKLEIEPCQCTNNTVQAQNHLQLKDCDCHWRQSFAASTSCAYLGLFMLNKKFSFFFLRVRVI